MIKKFITTQAMSVIYCTPMLLFIYMVNNYYNITYSNMGYFFIVTILGIVIYVITLIIFKSPAVDLLYQFRLRKKVGYKYE